MNCISQHKKAIELLRKIAEGMSNPQLDMAITQAEDSFTFLAIDFTEEMEARFKQINEQKEEVEMHLAHLTAKINDDGKTH